MLKRISLIAFMVMLAAMPAFAQKAEVGVTFGWSLNDGVSGGDQRIPIGCVSNCLGVFNRLDPKDAFAWAIDVGFFVSPNAEVGFLYSQSPSTLQAGRDKYPGHRQHADPELPRHVHLQLRRA